jgi:hypothetical protein
MKYIEPFSPVFKKMSDWPIYKLSQDRRRFIAEIDDFVIERLIKEQPKLYERNAVESGPAERAAVPRPHPKTTC